MSNGEYLNGLLQGENHGFYNNGNKKHILYFKKGKRVGENKRFYESGKLKFVSFMPSISRGKSN